jgi:hypothetical protein
MVFSIPCEVGERRRALIRSYLLANEDPDA